MNADGSIAFALTSQAVYPCPKSVLEYRRLRPSEIKDVKPAPNQAKHLADTLIIETMSGDAIEIQIGGGNGRFRDIYEVCRFFMRLRSDAAQFGEA